METNVMIMAVVRLIYGIISLTGGALIIYFKSLQTAMKINAFMGSIGPLVFLGVSLIGVVGLVGQLEVKKLVVLCIGVVLIMLGTR